MAALIHLKQQREYALNKADSLVSAAQNAKRELTAAESQDVDTCMAAVHALNTQIKTIESKGTIRRMLSPDGVLLTDGGGGRAFQTPQAKIFSDGYADEFYEYIQTRGAKIGAALYEGSSPAGGYAVPVVVDDQIVPLAATEMGVRALATVLPTVMDIKLPQQASFGTAAAKAENSAFGESDPTLSQITLSAFMAGIQHTLSWELAQDVPAFNAFAVRDMLLALQMYEENLFCNGTGSGQAQGLIGNVSTPIVREPDSAGNTVSISAILDLIGQLNSQYHPGAAFVMSRATSIIIRKAQVGANLFTPAWTRENGQDYLFSYPVAFSSSMPTAIRSNTPVLFGNFKDGYVIGDRGGSGINVKVLDQPLATQGQIILLAYRRMDARVRRTEAIQALTIASS